jgi:hypothetical protein
MLPDFQISSGAPKPIANTFYSRHLSLNDVRTQKEDNSSLYHRTSSQPLCDKKYVTKEKEATLADDNLEALKNSRKLKTAKKLAHKQYNAEEEKGDSSCALDSKEKPSLKLYNSSDIHLKKTENLENMDEMRNTRVVYETSTADVDGLWCQCSKQNNIFSTQSTRRKSQRAKTLRRNMMGTLVEEIPTETKCVKCHLEIREEGKRKERIIELWMQFFG